MPKTSRPTRIREFVSTSNRLKGQHDPTSVPSRPTRIGDKISSSHHPNGQSVPTPERKTNKYISLAQETPRHWLFRALVSMEPELGTSNKRMCSKAVMDGLLPQECKMRSRCGYLWSPNQNELEEAMDEIATCQEAHSFGKGGVESVHSVTRHSRAITMHTQQAITAIKQEGLEKAFNKLIGPRRSAREPKKGHGLA